jgi:nitrite reductase (NADH) small subunit
VRHELFGMDELRPGELRAVRIAGVAIVVMRTPAGDYRALRDSCSHHGAPLSHGRLQPVTVGDDVGCYELSTDRFVLRCPWHGYEFDTENGRCLADPEHARVRAYTVTVEGGTVFLER